MANSSKTRSCSECNGEVFHDGHESIARLLLFCFPYRMSHLTGGSDMGLSCCRGSLGQKNLTVLWTLASKEWREEGGLRVGKYWVLSQSGKKCLQDFLPLIRRPWPWSSDLMTLGPRQVPSEATVHWLCHKPLMGKAASPGGCQRKAFVMACGQASKNQSVFNWELSSTGVCGTGRLEQGEWVSPGWGGVGW